jgi:hypothetical protein
VKRKFFIVLIPLALAAVAYFFLFGLNWTDNHIPKEALHALTSQSSLTLYSLYPDHFEVNDDGVRQPIPEDVPKFHGYRILGQTSLTSPDARETVVSTILKAVREWDGGIGGCFQPRHGISVTDTSGTHDFVICFSCKQIYIYSPHTPVQEIYLQGSPQSLNAILTAANVALPDR